MAEDHPVTQSRHLIGMLLNSAAKKWDDGDRTRALGEARAAVAEGEKFMALVAKQREIK